ncbi:HD domain-containing protein [Nocardia thailandica]|uniref:Metal-dependent phosphohydrolase n=1 Tax=Nocardia thailandica TaxID=257275 RepID=A0ABW6PQB4_9NOCA|nr:metal-dependent phosphohydrolase [Nocardia thailandica]
MTPPSLELLDRWVALAGPGTEATGTALLARYAEPHRHYHTQTHLAVMLGAIDELAADADDPDAVRYAAFFHDAIYAVDRPDNERRSAELARATLRSLGAAAELVDEVERLVLLTVTHDPAPGDRNGAVLCDADLVVLGGSHEDYLAYTVAVRAEYAHVPDDLFGRGRAAVLRGIAGQPSIFRTARARERYEEAARANLAAELAVLTA